MSSQICTDIITNLRSQSYRELSHDDTSWNRNTNIFYLIWVKICCTFHFWRLHICWRRFFDLVKHESISRLLRGDVKFSQFLFRGGGRGVKWLWIACSVNHSYFSPSCVRMPTNLSFGDVHFCSEESYLRMSSSVQSNMHWHHCKLKIIVIQRTVSQLI